MEVKGEGVIVIVSIGVKWGGGGGVRGWVCIGDRGGNGDFFREVSVWSDRCDRDDGGGLKGGRGGDSGI